MGISAEFTNLRLDLGNCSLAVAARMGTANPPARPTASRGVAGQATPLCFPGNLDYTEGMLQYHVGFYMPRGEDRMVVAEVLDFPGVVSQGVDLADARAMIASALEDMAESYLEEGRPLPPPSATATDPEADYIELIPLSVAAGGTRPTPTRR